jgi:hypothetical protein
MFVGYCWCENLIDAGRMRPSVLVAIGSCIPLAISGVVLGESVWTSILWSSLVAGTIWVRGYGPPRVADLLKRKYRAYVYGNPDERKDS